MKNAKLARYDMERVYYLKEYQKTVAYAEQNISIAGVKEKLDSLKAEKSRYSKKVSALIEAERDNERQKYEPYEKWADVAKKLPFVFLGTLLAIEALIFFENVLSLPLYGILFGLIMMLLSLVLFVSGIATAFSFLCKRKYERAYQKYVSELSGQIDSLGQAFKQTSKDYYCSIDNLYLNSLDATQRELILMRREQAEHNRKLIEAEKERQRLQKKLIEEQQKTRATQEELLAIEREREERYKSRW